MVLIRAFYVLLVTASIASTASTAGCGQSLFDAHGDRRGGDDGGTDGGPDGSDGGVVGPETCEAPCIADAAASFIDLAGASWRYLDDRRNRIWVPMMESMGAMTSINLNNRIARCTGSPDPACRALSGSLLVSSAGMQSVADPAIEFRSADKQVIQLVLHAHVPGTSPAHRIRLYRNSREDLLFTALVAPGTTISHAVYVDAIPNDRFLISSEPTATPGGPIALRFFVRGPFTDIPSTCRLAVPFAAGSMANTISNLCGTELVSKPANPILVPGPISPQQGQAGYLEPQAYFEGTELLARGSAMTVQLWVLNDLAADPRKWLFSDLDPAGGGLGISFVSDGNPNLEVSLPTGPATYSRHSIPYPDPGNWHFVRVVHAGTRITICVDGSEKDSRNGPVPTASSYPPYLGRNAIWDPDPTTSFGGAIDDVRVFSEPLPCNN